MDPLIGRQIGPYVITEWLGEGGMAVVYKAHQPSLNRDVAIKILTGVLARDEELVMRFRREAVAAGALGHPNILTIYDAGTTDDGLYYIVMEYASGGTVKDLLRQGPLSVDGACDIAAQIADALQAAHDRGIIHRDLKPSNILLAGDGRPLLVDFGVALTASEPRLTRTGLALGTPEYMSPEQAQGQPVDGRTDVYALGAALYEMLSGQVLFFGETPLATLYRHVHEPAPDLSQMPGVHVPLWLAAVVSRALAKQPEERYQTAREMAAALRSRSLPHRVVRGSAVVEEPERIAPPDADPVQASAKPVGREGPSTGARRQSFPTPPPQAVRKKRPRWVPILAVTAIAVACLTCWLISRALDEWGSGTPLIVSPPDDGASQAQTATAAAAVAAAAIATTEANEAVAARVEATAAVIATRAAGATATALAEGEVIIVGPEEREWEFGFYDDFAADTGSWTTGVYDSERLSGNRRIAEGTYIWEAEAKQGFAWWSESGNEPITDFALDVVAGQPSGSSSGSYGVMFRHDEADNHYVFRIRDSGEYRVSLVQDGEWINLTDWTPTSLIYAGDPNMLSVGAEGPVFKFWINNELVAEISDETLPSGDVGLVIGLGQAGDAGRFEFDDFVLFTPPSE
ncbi:MAG TPA: serine/threonine-protein kinase [Anaerolineae bacterium]|nr:serine/threonine-protein kinase [Anaerolineae bacterium]